MAHTPAFRRPCPRRSAASRWGTAGLVLLLALSSACSSPPPPAPPPKAPPPATRLPKPYKVMGEWYQPMADARGFTQQGIASWYGSDFHGKPTSCGEIYNMYGISAAHKTLPLGTWVKVRNLDARRELDLRVNDRGPFVRGRVIDLSYGAAKELGVLGPGTAQVEIIALGTPAEGGAGYVAGDYYSGNFTFQVGAFRERDNAERLLARLERVYTNAHIVTWFNGSETLYRVRVGKCSSLDEAARYESLLVAGGFPDAFTIAE
jgi:rare lipoprotein A